jgi:hypothetical protein
VSKDITIFNYINAINYKKEIKYDSKKGNAYLLMLWMSHDKSIIDIVNKMNKYIFNVEDKTVFDYLYYAVPKGKRFLKWTKKDKKDYKVDLMETFEYSGLSKREIMLYKNFFI